MPFNQDSALNKPIALSNVVWIILVLLLLVSNIFFIVQNIDAKKELAQSESELKIQKTNVEILNFARLFVEKVLKAQNEIDFETRLKLENAIRDLNDQEILDQWNKFVNSQSEADAQEQVKNLLLMLVNKIKTK